MTIFTTSPEASGEIFAPEIVETAVLRYDQPDTDPDDGGTRRMPDFLATAPISPIPRGHTDQHAAIEIPQTMGIYPPPRAEVSSGARHALTGRVGLYPVVRPSLPLNGGFRAERRAAERRARRARRASWSVLAVLVAVVLVLAVLAVTS